jgi:DNA-binding SARP family transcriptional activator
MPRPTLLLLGSFQVTLDGRPVTAFESDKARALLAYLAVESDRPHTREKLAGLLLPDSSETAARASLSQALTNLRHGLGDRETEAPALLTSRQSIQFNRDSNAFIDAVTFADLTRGGDRARASLAGLEQAMALYRGRFLEGFSLPCCAEFEEWLLLKQEHLHRLASEALAHLAEAYEGQGNLERALAFTWKQLELVPWRESAHRQAMRLLAHSGRRDTALAQYQTCCRLLAEELAAQPAPETVRLYEQIRDGQLPVRPLPPRQVETHLVPPGFLSGQPPPVTRPAFVARENELARLDRFLKEAWAGHGQVAFVTGGPGLGKTALLHQFARRAMDTYPQLLVGSGSCSAYSGTGDPYLPFREIMNMLTGDVERLWAAGTISGKHAHRLWNGLPAAGEALVEYGPNLLGVLVAEQALLSRATAVATGEPVWLRRLVERIEQQPARVEGLRQSHIFAQMTRTLHNLAEEHPLLLMLDDLQWADNASISLLFHLGRRLETSRILIMGAYRPEELAIHSNESRHPLEKVLNEFKRQLGDVWIDLDQIREAENRRFVDALLDTQPNRLGAAFRDRLYARTAGHPLFTVELLRGMQERGDLVHNTAGQWAEGPTLDWDALPARTEAVIAERIGRLDRSLQEALQIASVAGEEFVAEAVAQVLETDGEALVQQLSGRLDRQHRLVAARGVQHIDGQLLSLYRFRHILFQVYLYLQLDEVERAHLHGQVGRALEVLYGGHPEALAEITPQLARHFERAGLAEQAIVYLHHAGKQAATRYAHAEALASFQRALALAEGQEGYDAILAHRAKVLLDVFQGQEAARDYGRLLNRTRQSGDRQGELEALLGLASAYYTIALDEPDSASQSLELYEQAYALAGELDDKAGMARALIPTIWFTDHWPEYGNQAVANIEEAWAISQELGDEELITDCMMARAARGLVSIDQAEELIKRLEARHDLPRLTAAYFPLLWWYLESGKFERCVECCDASISLAAKLDVPPVMHATIKALALLGLGRYDAAWAALQEEIADQEHPFGAAFKDLGTGIYYSELMAYGQAATVLEGVVEQANQLGRAWLANWGREELSRALVRNGQLTQNLADMDAPLTADVLGEIALQKGKLDEALRQAEKACVEAKGRSLWALHPLRGLPHVEKARSEAEGGDRRPSYLSPLVLQLQILLRLDRPEDVIPLVDEGIRTAEEMGYPALLWRFRAVKAQAMEMLGDDRIAAQEYEAAAVIVRELADTISDPQLKRSFVSNASLSLALDRAQSGTGFD